MSYAVCSLLYPVVPTLKYPISDIDSISHRFGDTTTSGLKNATFPYPLSFIALAWSEPFQFVQ